MLASFALLSSAFLYLGIAGFLVTVVLALLERRAPELLESRINRANNLGLTSAALIWLAVITEFFSVSLISGAIAALLTIGWIAFWLPAARRRYDVVSEIDINVPPTTVFACVSDGNRWPSYVAGIESVEVDPPGGGLGARVASASRVKGRVFRGVEEITEYQPPTRLVTTVTSGTRQSRGVYDLEAVPGGTHVRFTFEATTKPVEALLGSMLLSGRNTKKMLRQRRAQILADLKTLLESEP